MYNSDFAAIGIKWKRIICLFRGHQWCLYECTAFTGLRDVCRRCGKLRH